MSRPRIPSFRDVDQKVLGLVAVVVLAAVVVGAFAVGTVGIFDDRYLVRAVFDRTGGLDSSSDVRLAGVSVGSVTGIDPDYQRGHVVVTFEVDRGVDLGSGMRAEIAAATLLGGYYIRLDGDVDAPFLASLPSDDDRRVISNNRTLEPTSLNQVLDETTETVTAIDFDAANRVLEQVAGAADRNVDALPELIDDFTVISTAIAARDAELKRIVGGSEELLGALAEREAELALLVESSGRLLDQLASRRDALSAVLDRGGAAVDEAASLLVTHGDAIDRLIVDVSTITTELGDTLPSLNEALTKSQLLFPLLSSTLDPAGGFSIRGEGIIVHPGQAANIVDTVEDLLGILEVAP